MFGRYPVRIRPHACITSRARTAVALIGHHYRRYTDHPHQPRTTNHQLPTINYRLPSDMPQERKLPRIVRRRSKVHGWGVFALEPINKNTRIVTYNGELIDHKE